jgi:imidazolonepropionase-like amidohydrolase
MRCSLLLVLCLLMQTPLFLQNRAPSPQSETVYLLKPARVFDGESAQLHDGWVVLVRGQKIEAAGPASTVNVPTNATIIDLPGLTLLPGLIEAHSHILLHPYIETPWNDQVAHESLSLRVARATNHLRNTLQAGFTYASEWRVPQGAEEADGVDSLTRVVRDQIGHGADWIKVYADYRWGTQGAAPTFSLEELKLAVETARSANVPVAAHATTTEGMRRAILAGVETIEHGDGGTPEIFRLMKEHNVALCPTLAIAGANAERKKAVFKAALEAGVTIASGSDVGVFAHGDNVRELEAMVNFGMPVIDALRSATSIDARVLHMAEKIGQVKPGLFADVIAVEGDPTRDISSLRHVKFVMKGGIVYRQDR